MRDAPLRRIDDDVRELPEGPVGAAHGAADLHVFAPTALRGGLYYEGRFTIDAQREIEKAVLVLDGGWTEQTQINTIEPAPIGESSRDGRLALDLGHVPAGQKLVAWMQFQVNPTNVEI